MQFTLSFLKKKKQPRFPNLGEEVLGAANKSKVSTGN